MTKDELRALIRTVPDFPVPGVQFRDITTLIGNGEGLCAAVEQLADHAAAGGAEAIAGMEARGFIFGAAVAVQLRVPFIPIRKPGKLPIVTIGVDYHLEYGTDRLEMDPEAVAEGQKVAIVDDLIATGGTARAAVELLRKTGAKVEHALFVIGLPDLGGMTSLQDASLKLTTLVDYAGD